MNTRAQEVLKEAGFMIVELNPSGIKPVYDGDGQLLHFADGKKAADRARDLSVLGTAKFQVRAISNDNWREREARRLAKDYTLLPWHKERWWHGLKGVWAEHYPHVSILKDAMLAYTENDEKGAADIQTRIKPGRYLERHFGAVLNAHVIRDLCTQFSAKFEDNMLMFASEPDEIEEIYLTGPSSCMSKAAGEFASKGVHPTRVYGAGDLQVAFLRRDGRIVARTMVWTDKKLYTSIYGDAGRIKPLLEKQGFKYGAPHGAKLLKIKQPQVSGGTGKKLYHYVTPHLDNVGWVFDRGTHLEIGHSSQMPPEGIGCGGARGVTEVLGYICPKCNTDTLPQRAILVVYVSNGPTPKTANWCAHCVRKEAFTCPASGYLIANDQGTAVQPKQRVWNRFLTQYAFQCKGTGEWWQNQYKVTMKDGGVYSRSYAEGQGAKRCTCGHWVFACEDACKEAYKKKQAAAKKQMAGMGGTGGSTTYTSTATNSWYQVGR